MNRVRDFTFLVNDKFPVLKVLMLPEIDAASGEFDVAG